jgi:amino acid adenylation domain-containing protein
MSQPIEAAYRLTPMQQGLLFHSLSRPDEPTYFEQIHWTIEGDLDPDLFVAAWDWVMSRHPVLRSGFAWKELKEPVQLVGSSVKMPLDFKDWRGLANVETEWQLLLADDAKNGFELSHAPLMRLALRRAANDRHLCLWSHHHILIDGWSFGIVLREVQQCYASLVTSGSTPKLPDARPFADFVRFLENRNAAADRRFWRRYLAGIDQSTRLQIDRGQGVQEGGIEKTISILLDEKMSADIQKSCGQMGISLSALVHAAWGKLLAAYSGQSEVLFGSTTSGRPPELDGVEAMVGLFINAVPVRIKVAPDRSVAEWLGEIQRDLFKTQEHQYLGTAAIRDASAVESGEALFETLLSFQNYPLDSVHAQNWGGIRLVDYGWSGPTNYPLAIRAFAGKQIMLVLSHYEHRISSSDAGALLTKLRSLIERLGLSPNKLLWEVPALDDGEAQRILWDWNATSTPIDQNRTLHSFVAKYASLRPDSKAVIAGDGELSYRELEALANQLARELLAMGVIAGDHVGICMEKSYWVPVAMLGIMKAGAAYVPIDPSYPGARIAFMAGDAQLAALLTWGAGTQAVGDTAVATLALDTDSARVARHANTSIGTDISPELFAYVIYTSGSSGQPKGLMLNHSGRVNNVVDHIQRFSIGADDRNLCVSSLSFDISVLNIFSSFASGGCVVFPHAGHEKDPEHWLDLARRHRITQWHSAPMLMEALIEAASEAPQPDVPLRMAMLDGDWIPVNLPDRIRRTFTGVDLVSAGGATELSVNSIHFPIGDINPAWRSIPYGRPMGNSTALILSPDLELAPPGVVGELCLGGFPVAAGYFGRPELTAEKFIPNPWAAQRGERLYRTGDLARFDNEGVIELMGRMDFQVKLRGIRVELGELEVVLSAHPDVRACIAAAPPDDRGERRLVAYVVSAAASIVPNFDQILLDWLRDRVPDQLVPDAITLLERLPLTPNGKIDRASLPAPVFAHVKAGRQAPTTPLERDMVRRWAEVLNLAEEEIDVDTSFFRLGGNSLKAIRACRLPNVSIPITNLYRYPSIRELVRAVAEQPGALVRLTKADPPIAAICVPFGGGHSGVYMHLAEALDGLISVYSVALPGHEHDGQETLLQPIQTVADTVISEIRAMEGRPLIVYGHCGGVALAAELARRLEADGANLIGVIMGAAYPPTDPSILENDPYAALDDLELASSFARLGGFDDITNEEATTVGRLLRHDGYEARKFFKLLSASMPRPLQAPLICLIGDEDPLTQDYRDGWRGWQQFAEHANYAVVRGGHYFVRENPELVAKYFTQFTNTEKNENTSNWSNRDVQYFTTGDN